MSYDFRTLDSEEFEKLIRDILAKKFDCHIERFGKGRDGGVDLRFNSNGGEKVVVQCKHYANSTLSNLLSTLKNEELKKVKEMKLSRYMVVTSLNLTPNNKEKIMEIMTPHIKSESDIWGLTEINDYVNEYKDIELRNYKLWFRSTSVLSNVINAGVHNRTKILLNKIKNKVEYYVEPEEFDLAYQMVDEENYCIICGKPGIGKSSLAEVLLFRYFKEDYMIIKVNDIQEILQLHNSEIKQIFYFDDFLGQTELSFDINSGDSGDFSNFIESITEKGSNTKMILTTRGYILETAKVRDCKSNKAINRRFCVRLNENQTLFNAKVLLKYLSKTKRDITDLVKRKRYKGVVQHKNFSPRIIEHLLSKDQCEKSLYDELMYALEHPQEIWENAFVSLNENLKALLLIPILYNKCVELDELFNKYCKLNKRRGDHYKYTLIVEPEKNLLRQLTPTFLDTEVDEKAMVVRYGCPSIEDYLKFYINQGFRAHDYCFMLDIIDDYSQLMELINKTELMGIIHREPVLKIRLCETLEKIFIVQKWKMRWSVQLDSHCYEFRLMLANLNELLYRFGFVSRRQNLFWNYTISDCMKQDVVVNDMFSRLLKYTMSKAQDTRESKEYLWDAVEIFKKNNLFCNYEEVWDSIYEFYTAFIPEEENLNCFYYYCEIMDYAAKEINVAFEESIRKRILEVFSHGRYDTNDIDTHSEGGIESAIAKLRVVDDYFGVCMRSTIIGLEEASEELQRGRYEERIAQDDEIEYLNRAESSSENDFLFGVGQDKEIETLFEEFNKKIGG